MKLMKHMVLMLFAIFLLTMMVACQEKDGPAEKVGEKIDQTIEKAGEKMEEAGDKIEEAGDKVKKETQNNLSFSADNISESLHDICANKWQSLCWV